MQTVQPAVLKDKAAIFIIPLSRGDKADEVEKGNTQMCLPSHSSAVFPTTSGKTAVIVEMRLCIKFISVFLHVAYMCNVSHPDKLDIWLHYISMLENSLQRKPA